MSKKRGLLDKMRANPRGDWQIRDVERLCHETGMQLVPPGSGSHFKVYSDHLRDVLTIPAHRPIKPPYIRNLVSYCDSHLGRVEHPEKDK